jgi:hypothetical protein
MRVHAECVVVLMVAMQATRAVRHEWECLEHLVALVAIVLDHVLESQAVEQQPGSLQVALMGVQQVPRLCPWWAASLLLL